LQREHESRFVRSLSLNCRLVDVVRDVAPRQDQGRLFASGMGAPLWK